MRTRKKPSSHAFDHAWHVLNEHQRKLAEAALAVGATLPFYACDCDLCIAAHAVIEVHTRGR